MCHINQNTANLGLFLLANGMNVDFMGKNIGFCLDWSEKRFSNIFYWLCYYSCPIFFSLLFLFTLHPPPYSIPSPFSSCPWILHISSLASPFPILFLTSPCLFCTYHSCILFPVPFPPFSTLHLPTDNPPCDIHFCDSVPVLVVCLVSFWFF